MLIATHTPANLEVLTQHQMVIRELTGRTVLQNTIMTMMTMEDQLNIRMILMVGIIMIGRMVLEVQHIALDGNLLQE